MLLILYPFSSLLSWIAGEDIFQFYGVLTIIFIGTLLVSLILDFVFYLASKEKCDICSEELGEEYYNGKIRYKELSKEDEIWAHKRCIPRNELKEWKKTR